MNPAMMADVEAPRRRFGRPTLALAVDDMHTSFVVERCWHGPGSGTCQCLVDSVLFSSSTASRGLGLVRQPGSYQDGAMIKTALLPADLNRLTRETDMLLATVDSLTDEEFAALRSVRVDAHPRSCPPGIGR